MLLHGAALGGLLWWMTPETPGEIPEQGVELMWDQPNQASLVAGPEGDTARPEAPPSVAPPPAPEAEPQPPAPAAAPPPPPPVPRLAEPVPAPAAAPPPPPAAAPPAPVVAAPLPPPPSPAPISPPPLAQLPDGVLPPPPPPSVPQTAAAPPPPPGPPRPEAARPEPTPPERQAAEPAPPQPRPQPQRPTRQANPPPAPRQNPAVQPGPPQPAEPPASQPGGGVLAQGATTAPSLDPACANPPPTYPAASRLRGEEGVVRIIVTIGPNGRAQGTQIIGSSGFPALDEAGRRAVLGWCFRPAQRNGEAVQGQVATNIRFRLQ